MREENPEYDATQAEYDSDDGAIPLHPEAIGGRIWLMVAVAFLPALLLALNPWTRSIFSVLDVMVHELGHAVFAWAAGRGALPRLDFQYGGGVTPITKQMWFFLPIYLFVWGYIAYRLRRNWIAWAAIPLAVILHAIYAFSGVDIVIFLYMGHGFELVIAGVFLYRALSGEEVKHIVERPLYAVVAWFMLINSLRFGWRLSFSSIERWRYDAGKGGGHLNDFTRIANEYLHIELRSLVYFFLICTLLVPLLSFLAARYRQYIHHGVYLLLDTKGA